MQWEITKSPGPFFEDRFAIRGSNGKWLVNNTTWDRPDVMPDAVVMVVRATLLLCCNAALTIAVQLQDSAAGSAACMKS